jgi:hypothetical protein
MSDTSGGTEILREQEVAKQQSSVFSLSQKFFCHICTKNPDEI